MDIYIKVLSIILVFALVPTSCTKDFEEINTPRDLLLQDQADVDQGDGVCDNQKWRKRAGYEWELFRNVGVRSESTFPGGREPGTVE